jgi:hypothetical protein
MTRPSAAVIDTVVDRKTGTQLEILAAPGVWVVTYHGAPFNLKKTNAYTQVTTKYAATVHVNQRVAENAARRLNTKFQTTAFTVQKARL